jgi:23S rRNA (cytosine1962-C5)-methyltransferase
MFSNNEYQLLDFGDGRRLERFGPIVLDRLCPAAENIAKTTPKIWQAADARFEGRNEKPGSGETLGSWTDRRALPESWSIAHGPLQFELKRTDFGHLGIFPEQAANWDWIAQTVQSASSPFKVLNLFAYTGGSTLAAAAAGAQVTHVDAAKNIVAWARRNAELSDLVDAPIRWIADDAVKFVKRELKRGNPYHAVILDPPSYGHGTKGEVWQLAKDLPPLLTLLNELTEGRPAFLLLTCHTPGFEEKTLCELVQTAFGPKIACNARQLFIESAAGKKLPSGVAATARFPA